MALALLFVLVPAWVYAVRGRAAREALRHLELKGNKRTSLRSSARRSNHGADDEMRGRGGRSNANAADATAHSREVGSGGTAGNAAAAGGAAAAGDVAAADDAPPPLARAATAIQSNFRRFRAGADKDLHLAERKRRLLVVSKPILFATVLERRFEPICTDEP